jgi:hypothetical protein
VCQHGRTIITSSRLTFGYITSKPLQPTLLERFIGKLSSQGSHSGSLGVLNDPGSREHSHCNGKKGDITSAAVHHPG